MRISRYTKKYIPLGKQPATLKYKDYLHHHIKNALYVPATIAEEEVDNITNNIENTSEQVTNNVRLSLSEDSYITLPSLINSTYISNDDLYLQPISITKSSELLQSENVYDVPTRHHDDKISITNNDDAPYYAISPRQQHTVDNHQPIYEEIEEVIYEEILDIPTTKPSFFHKIQSAVKCVEKHIAQASNNIAVKLNIIKSNLEPLIESGIDKVVHFWHELNLHENVAVHYHAANNKNDEPNIEFTNIKNPIVLINYFNHNDDTNNIDITGLSDDYEDTYL